MFFFSPNAKHLQTLPSKAVGPVFSHLYIYRLSKGGATDQQIKGLYVLVITRLGGMMLIYKHRPEG